MNKSFNLDVICLKFGLSGTLLDCREFGNGNINGTYVLTFLEGGRNVRYTLQNINTEVFKKPFELMENLAGVTSHIKKYYNEKGLDPTRRTLDYLPCDDGNYCFIDENGNCWRVYKFIEDAITFESIDSPEVFCESGRAFGEFQNILSTYDVSTLHDVIPDFHNTAKRFEAFKQAVKSNIANRLSSVEKEVDFILQRENDTHVLTDLAAKGELPLRVTHNDTKVNNILFDKETHEGICIIDLDTVMTGLSLYDFGDSIRSGANKTAEDDPNTDNIGIDLTLYEAFVSGFLSSAGKALTETEKEYLPFSAKLLTFECGMRFLTDYLNGDTYFKTSYPEHNLVRTRNQLKLVKSIEENMEEMKSITKKYC